MIRYVDAYRAQFGVEAICRTLRATECGFITARGFRAAVARSRSDRSLRDEQLVAEITRIHGANFSVYGVRKMHVAMTRAGWDVGRDQVARLMRVAGVQGARRGRKAFTTVSDPQSPRPADLVERRFAADGPGRLWVADITYVATWAGFAYAAFVTDAFSRRIVGWAVSPSLTTQALPMQALNMAAFMNTVGDTLKNDGQLKNRPIKGFIQIFQGTPLLMQLFLVFFGAPVVGIEVSPWVAAGIALVLNTSAFLGEIWRGSIQAVPSGQLEAAQALGLPYTERMRWVVLPQAFKIALPSTVGYMVQVIKGTSLAAIIGFTEITRAGQIINNATFEPLLVFSIVGAIYFALCWPLSFWASRIERRQSAALAR